MCNRCFLASIVVLFGVTLTEAQDYSKWLFNAGGGIGFPQGNITSFINYGGHFVVGGGYKFSRTFGVDSEFMWHNLPINSATKGRLQTSEAKARQYAWTFNPILHAPFGSRFGAYAIGGIGWYHRSGETTSPGLGVVCDPYWSWWLGCTIGLVNIVTGTSSSNSFGENFGGGLTVRLGDSRVNVYTEIRFHSSYKSAVSTNLLPLTFGIRW